ncbi:MAG: pyrroline-5-carboxylate reductase family protein, partial [Thermodesulforhabdaceae bacterium]
MSNIKRNSQEVTTGSIATKRYFTYANYQEGDFMEGTTIGFIGTGNMGRALIEGILAKGIFKPSSVATYDVVKEKAQELAETFGVRVCESLKELVSLSRIIVIAVKPQNVSEVLQDIKHHIAENTLVVSIAAGISLKFLEDRLPERTPIVRVMPNTPALVLHGTSVLARNRHVSNEA